MTVYADDFPFGGNVGAWWKATKIRTTRGPLLRKLFGKKRCFCAAADGEEQKSCGRNREDDVM